MPQDTEKLAVEAAQGIQELNEAVAAATQGTAELTERDWELLGTVGNLALAIAALAALPEESAAAIGAVTAIAAVGATLGIASSVMSGTVLAFDVLGINSPNERDHQLTELIIGYTSNPFSVVLGSTGYIVEGDYGFESGVTVGEFGNILFDANEYQNSILERKDSSLVLLQLLKEIVDFKHSTLEKLSQGEDLNADSMIKNMIEYPARVSTPAHRKNILQERHFSLAFIAKYLCRVDFHLDERSAFTDNNTNEKESNMTIF